MCNREVDLCPFSPVQSIARHAEKNELCRFFASAGGGGLTGQQLGALIMGYRSCQENCLDTAICFR